MELENTDEGRQALAILRVLKNYSRRGITAMRIATESELALDTVHELLGRHKDWFVRVGKERRYTVNPFGECKGDPENIAAAIEKKIERARARERILLSQVGL